MDSKKILNEEIELDPLRQIVSTTDPAGVITFGNIYFVKISGYSEAELLGAPHNIIRHPDMPKIVFKLMWDTIKQGKDFCGVVKNLAKSGKFYWVMTEFNSKRDPQTGEIISYTAYRKAPPRSAIEIIEPIYKAMLEAEQIGGMNAGLEVLNQFLAQRKQSYEEFFNEITGKETPAVKKFFASMKAMFSKN